MKMAPGGSPLLQFIRDALIDEKYPNLIWFKRDEGIVCLDCPLKSRNEWNPSFERIFNDYGKLKPRKSDDNRQRFLQAMKVCPFIKLLQKLSSKEKKYYQFKEDYRHGEITAILSTNEDVDMQTVQLSSINKIETTTGGAYLVDNVNDFGCFSSLISSDNCVNETPITDEENQSDIGQLLKKLGASNLDTSITKESFSIQNRSINPAENVFVNPEELLTFFDNICSEDYKMDMVCPNVAADNPESPENGNTSLFNNLNDLLESSVGCNATPVISDQFNLSKEELSYTFPYDYDPEKEFMKSVLPVKNEVVNTSTRIVKAGPDQFENVKMVPGTSEESPKWEIAEVHKLEENDAVMKCIQPIASHVPDNWYMMVLKQRKI